MTLYRYILRNLLKYFIITYLILSVIIVSFVTLQSINRYRELSIETLITVIPYILLPFFIRMIPISFFSAVITTMSKMKTDNELLALSSLGMKPINIAKPFVMFSLILILVLKMCFDYLVPEANYKLLKIITTRLDLSPRKILQESNANRIEIGDLKLFFKNKKGNIFFDVILVRNLGDNRKETIIAKKVAVFFGDEKNRYTTNPNSISLELSDVYVFQGQLQLPDRSIPEIFDRWPLTNDYFEKQMNRAPLPDAISYMDKYKFSTEIKTPAIKVGYKELKTNELIRYMNLITTSNKERQMFLLEYYKREAMSFTPIIFCILGILLGIVVKGKLLLSKLFISLLTIAVLYYPSLLFAESNVLKNVFTPLLGGWFPNIVVLFISLLLFFLKRLRIL